MLGLLIDEELQTIIIGTEVFQQNAFWLAVRLFHIIDQELFEIAGNYPTWTL